VDGRMRPARRTVTGGGDLSVEPDRSRYERQDAESERSQWVRNVATRGRAPRQGTNVTSARRPKYLGKALTSTRVIC